MKKKIKCYTYTRVSTAMQVDGYSLDAQKEKLKRYADYEVMEIVGEYSDEGYSGKNINGRPEFIRMLEDIEDGKDGISYVLVFRLSRFGRNAADVLNSLKLMQDFHHLIRAHLQERDVVLCFQSVPEGSQMLLHKNPQMMQKAREGKWKRAN